MPSTLWLLLWFAELKLVIEIDGAPHLTDEGREHDRTRDQYMTKLGYRDLRVPGNEVIREEGNAHQYIWGFVKKSIEELER